MATARRTSGRSSATHDAGLLHGKMRAVTLYAATPATAACPQCSRYAAPS